MLKVSFKSTGEHRPFLSKFDVKLGSWGMINTGDHRPLEVSTKFDGMGMVGEWTGYQLGPSIFFILCGYIDKVYI